MITTCRQAMIAALTVGVAALLGACASNAPPLPDLKRPEVDGMMTPAQQQQAIADLARKKDAEQVQATKAIEKTR
jgi:hypothetical protein